MPTILIVDTVRANRDLVRASLHEHGHSCVEAEDTAEALCLLRAIRPDVAVLDVDMFETQDLPLSRAIRLDATKSTIPLVFYAPTYITREPTSNARRDANQPTRSDLRALMDAIDDALGTDIMDNRDDQVSR